MDDAGRLADLAASNLSLRIEQAQEILAILDPAKRLRHVYDLLTREGAVMIEDPEAES